jgi:N4-gp56 family major capsid protein
MPTQNKYSTFSSDVVNYIAEKTLPNVVRQLVAYQAGEPLRLKDHSGLTYQATRYLRVPLPVSPLTEGVPPLGETMTIQTVTATAQQWGDTVTVTDVADLTIKHPVFKKAIELVTMQQAETIERNTFNNLLAGTQVNYANAKGSRANLLATDVMTTFEINRIVSSLNTIGAPRYMGDEREDMKLALSEGIPGGNAKKALPHYLSIIHPDVATDLRQNSTIVTAWSYSDVNKLYNFELGEWGGVRFTMSNMVPVFTGFAAVVGTPVASGGSLATATTYHIQVTGSDANTGYENQVYQIGGALSVTGPTGSITLTTPNVAGYNYNVYIANGATPANLANGTGTSATLGTLAAGSPLTGLVYNTAAVIQSIGSAQTPPAAPGTGVSVFPTFFFGRGAYGQVVLDDVKFSYLRDADKSDPLNQLRVVGWKMFYGTIILNNQFFARTESGSAFGATFS